MGSWSAFDVEDIFELVKPDQNILIRDAELKYVFDGSADKLPMLYGKCHVAGIEGINNDGYDYLIIQITNTIDMEV